MQWLEVVGQQNLWCTYSYDTLYIEIDGEKSGEYIKLDDWVQP